MRESGRKLALPRGAGPVDLRSEGPSGPCRSYRPGEIEWAPACVSGRVPTACVAGEYILLNKAAREILGGRGARIRVGYEGVPRRVVLRKDPAGEYRIGANGQVFSRPLMAWLRERGLQPGQYALELAGQDLVLQL